MVEELEKLYGRMSSEKLEEMLDFNFSASSDALDEDAVLAILEVLEQRKADASQGSDETAAMWARFSKHYLPGAENGSLYADSADSGAHESPSEAPKRRRSGFGPVFRAASIMLVLGILLTGIISTTAYANGFDLWGIVARWTEEQFSFGRFDDREIPHTAAPGDSSRPTQIPQSADYDGEYETLSAALAANGIDEPLAPAWLPEGYALSEIAVTETSDRTSVIAEYVTEDERVIGISIMRHGDNSGSFTTHEKDGGEVQIYRTGGVEHYIMSNLGQTIITWISGSCECTVRGEFSADAAREIIDSIYERS